MKHITDDDLTLLYYGEHDDPDLAARVAESHELSARFEALSEALGQFDNLAPPDRADDYGSDVWRRISSRLASGAERPAGRWRNWLTAARQPRFSWASALSLALVAALAFMLGRQGSQSDVNVAALAEATPVSQQAGLDAERLLTSSVSDHLEQLNLVFTEFANSNQTSLTDAGRITDILVANRLYRQAAVARGDQQLAAFLSELEPILIEMAHEAHTESPTSHARMQEEIRNNLLFRIRVMNQQLNNSNLSA
jgi:hypothetical protein